MRQRLHKSAEPTCSQLYERLLNRMLSEANLVAKAKVLGEIAIFDKDVTELFKIAFSWHDLIEALK